MRPPHHTLHRNQVHHCATTYLQHYLPLRPYKRKVTPQTLWAILLVAAAQLSSVHATCQHLEDIPAEETIRKALIASLPDYVALQRQLNRALAAPLPRGLRRRRQRLALDLTLLPYHGRPFHDPAEIYRSLAKSGTSHFHAYATAYLVLHGQRFTVALTPVAKGEPLKDVVQRLLQQASAVGIKPRLVLLDRGFYSVDVIRYLQAARYPFLMPVVCHGRKPSDPRGPSGSAIFAARKTGGWFDYTLENARGRKATVAICVVCRNWAGRRGRRGRQALVYAYWGIVPRTYQWVFQTYRQRFGIETSYRQMHQGLIRTSTRRPILRLLYVGIALVLRNLWVWLHFEVLSRPRRGRRVIDLEQLPFAEMLDWLREVIEERWRTVAEIVTERKLCMEILI